MSTPKKASQEKLSVEPLKENELGQIEGGFSEIIDSALNDDSGFDLNVSCPTNQSQCGTKSASK